MTDKRIALVSGANKGIGFEIARQLAQAGVWVIVGARDAERGRAAVQALDDQGLVVSSIALDLNDPKSISAAAAYIQAEHGKLDILVNNAGVAVAGEIGSFALADFDHTLNVNVRAVFVATQAAVRHMGQGGAYGRVITIGSTNSDRVPWPGFSVYGMSKAAIVGLTKGLARDLGPRGITVNNVQPGPVNTDMNPADGPMAGDMHGLMALDRHAHPDEIAGMVAYLAGPESGMVTGASLLIDGGFAA